MSDNTCFKLLIADASWDIREHLQSYGSLFQVFIPRDSPNVVYAKYKHVNSANNAKRALVGDERVISVEPMEMWPFEKKQKSKSSVNTSSDSGECSDGNLPLRKPLECHKCCGYAELMCSMCAAWYCSEQCQLLDWHVHRKNCIPRLVRGFPVLTSLQNLAITNTQQLQAQQQKAKQTQQTQQQPLAQQTQQKDQQQVQQTKQQQQQQQQQERAQHQQQQQQHLMNEQLRKEKESGLNLDKRFAPIGANQTEQAKRQPDRPMEQPRANGVQQQAKDDLSKKKPNTSENPDKANNHHIPANKLDANVVKPAPQEMEKRASAEMSQLKGQQNKPAAQSVLPNKSDDPALKKQPSQAAVASNVALNGPKRATQGLDKSEQPGGPTSPPKVADDPPKAAQGPSFLQKRMQALATAKRTIAYNAFPAVGSTVAISVVSEKTLHIHETSDDVVNDPFMSFIKRCILHASEIKQQLQHPPAVGEIVFAPFDDNYYRAIVKKCEGDSAVVMFPDFGNSQPIHWKLLKEIRDANVKYGTCMTHAVSLFAEGPFSPAVQNFLSDLIEEQPFEVTRVEANATAGVRKVELRHLRSKYILSAKIRELTANDPAARAKQTEAAEQKRIKLVATDPATYKPVYSTEFKDSCIPNDGFKEEELIIVEASQFPNNQAVSVILALKQRPFAMVLKECEEYGRLDSNEYRGEPEPNYACLVRYDNTWSRAMKVENADQYYLLDFGIIRGLDTIDAVRRFPPALSRELFCVEYMVDNPEMLTKLLKESDYSTDTLRGRFVKAKLCVDRETELFHMKIVSISV
uniref:MYND-type domain-containing protein n=1 Tax=Anopheles atroparvus TaxID=41427 RepID=A0AAG5CRU7_ANOAO